MEIEQENILGGKRIRQVVFFILMIGLTWFVISRFANLQNLIHSLGQGELLWVLAAAGAHVVFFLLNAALYQSGFRSVGVKNGLLELFPVLMAALAVNAVAPTGGTGGAAVFVNYNAKHDKSGARTATGVVLTLLADLSTLIPFIIWSMVFLSQSGELKYYEILGFAAYLIFILGLFGILILADKRPKKLEGIFGWFRGIVNGIGARFHRPNLISEEWARSTADEFSNGAQAIDDHPHAFLKMLGIGVIMHFVNLLGLYLLFVAYRQPIDLGLMVAGFTLGIVFFVVAVIPQGVGAVEGIMTLVFISMGIPKLEAITIAVAFRGLNLWIPLVVGALSLKKVT